MPAFEDDHIRQLRPYLPECMVLLKRDGAFPLDGPCRIAAFGSGVRDTVKGGSGSGEVNSRYFTSIEQGLERAGFTITNKDWADRFAPYLRHAKEQLRREAWRRAREEKVNFIVASMGLVLKQPEYHIELDLGADAAIYVVSRLSGEGNDRLPDKGDFRLTDSETADITTLDKAYERFMLIINAGGPVDLSEVAHVRNILVMSQLGVEGGDGVADVLLGKAYPSGKLTTTWSAYEDYCALGDFAQRDDTRYREGVFVGYRYFDAVGKQPLFPFGFGLGYTTFEMGRPSCDCAGPAVTVTARITNTGTFRGKETLQVYACCPQGKLSREVKSLAGFAKTRELQPGESDILAVTFDVRDLAGFEAETARFILEPGRYVLLAGTSSADAHPCAAFDLAREVAVKQVRNLFGHADFEDAALREGDPFATDGLPLLDVDLGSCEPCEIAYDDTAPDIPELSLLADEDLCYLGIGAFDPKDGLLSIIGNASQRVAGAAGESTSQLGKLGIGSLIMADGPAGLRLARQFYEDAKGAHAIGISVPESLTDMLPGPVRWILRKPPRLKKGTVVHEQHATALPIATAIAQSFNLEFAELCGDIVGNEMDAFGIDLWLAPALNIHRNVLCARNFEYYSEDPLVSGLFAAAITRGVQRHAGRGVTVKHYAANNQETNRYASNSIVSERALREVYLRGFEICIRESSPRAVMTSYNLVNGTHTSERRDLTDALRCEFGFDGIVMTDWIVGGDLLTANAKYAPPNPANVAAAGCSLFMPGSKDDYQALLAGLAAGTVTREALQRNAAFLLKTLWEMQAAQTAGQPADEPA